MTNKRKGMHWRNSFYKFHVDHDRTSDKNTFTIWCPHTSVVEFEVQVYLKITELNPIATNPPLRTSQLYLRILALTQTNLTPGHCILKKQAYHDWWKFIHFPFPLNP
jgi:hypothetical protein